MISDVKLSESAPLRDQVEQLLKRRINLSAGQNGNRLPSVRDLADEFGVSRNTISQAIANLRKQGLLSTRNKVGVFLRTNEGPVIRTGDIGVIYTGTDPFPTGIWLTVLGGVVEAACEAGRDVVLPGRGTAAGVKEDWNRLTRTGKIGGVVIITTKAPPPDLLDHMQKRNIPVVLTDWWDATLKVDTIMLDNVAGSKAIVSRLLNLGHRRIAFLNSVGGSSADERHEGYRQALAEAGVAYDSRLVRGVYPLASTGRAAMRELMAHEPTAVYTFSDFHAIGAIQAIEATGLRVPQDVSVASFGNQASGLDLERPLTTIHGDMHAMGKAAAERILQRMQGDESPAQIIRVRCPLIEGDTTAPCRELSRRTQN
ncbi:MAG TPA: GntR family transcriptional regulator [Planctomycetota bacterium]|nr:GntR family transcriptional regulator [Planctomycetota bacterium]